MARQPEGKLVAKIKDFLVEQGARPIKIVGSEEGYQEIGISDLLVCYKGRFVGLEVKQPGGKLRPAQRVFLHEIVAAGGYAAVITTVDEVARLLADLDMEVEPASHYRQNIRFRESVLRRSINRVR